MAADESTAVRFAAASYLFHAGHQAEAVPVLKEIESGRGGGAVMAMSILLDSGRAPRVIAGSGVSTSRARPDCAGTPG
jgi:hypothetical protein